MDFKTHIENALINAYNLKSKLNSDIMLIDGMTGQMTRHFYNNLLDIPDINYLEIGTWKGSSSCSCLFENKINATLIDNWTEFNGPRDEFIDNINKFKGKNNVTIHENDCFSLDLSLFPNKFDIYLYDGNHNADAHYKAIGYFLPCLNDEFIYLVDDWNWEQIRVPTEQSIKDLNLEVLYKHEIRLTDNNEHTPIDEARLTWWNGLAIFILKKQ